MSVLPRLRPWYSGRTARLCMQTVLPSGLWPSLGSGLSTVGMLMSSSVTVGLAVIVDTICPRRMDLRSGAPLQAGDAVEAVVASEFSSEVKIPRLSSPQFFNRYWNYEESCQHVVCPCPHEMRCSRIQNSGSVQTSNRRRIVHFNFGNAQVSCYVFETQCRGTSKKWCH